MKSDAYIAVDIETCRRQQHCFKIAGSDKTPLKCSLICLTCSDKTGKSAYAAYGDETKSYGEWRDTSRREEA